MGEQTAEALQGKGGLLSLKGVRTFKFNLSVFLSSSLSVSNLWPTERQSAGGGGGDETWAHHALCGLGAFCSSHKDGWGCARVAILSCCFMAPGHFSLL